MPSTNYPIVETFHSIQGEGMQTGEAAFFVRFGGCNLACLFDAGHKCDEPLHTQKDKFMNMTAMEIDILARKVPNTLNIIITGGEPSMNGAVGKLIRTLKSFGYYVAVETNGYKIDRLLDADLITYSPKVMFDSSAAFVAYEPEIFHDKTIELKLLAGTNCKVDSRWDDYPIKFVQPIGFEEELDMDNVRYCSNFVTNNPDWKLSIQMQKVIKVQ